MLSLQRLMQYVAIRKRCFHTSSKKCGYIVLVPEIGEEGLTGDITITPGSLPDFNDITIENCLGAIGRQAGAVEKTVKQIESNILPLPTNKSIDTVELFRKLDEATGPLDTTWGIAKALYLGNSTLIPTKTYMNIHDRARKARASKFCSKPIYDALQKEKKSIVDTFDERLLRKYLLEGGLNGLGLKDDARADLKEVLLRLGRERANFKNKVNISMHSFAHLVKDYQLVRDFPSTLLEATIIDNNNTINQGPWKFTLQPQVVDGFLKHCPDRVHRWNIWQANVRKASTHMDKSLENSTHIEKIRSLRKRQANILGYPNYATMSMQTKMASNISNLKQLFSKLLQFAGPAQSVEIEQLQNFATASGFEHRLDVYDVSYWQRKYLLSKYKLDEQTLRIYFPLPKVLSGLFAFSESLFGIKIVERTDAQVWQPLVKYYDVYDNDRGVKSVGGFYIDCYSKENKFGKNNGWMVSIRNRNDSAKLSPLCALIFNFTPPSENEPCLLSMDDLRMIFKTFGSALQHILTEAPFTDLAGLSNIEWDASQVAGCVLSNFLDNPLILKTISDTQNCGPLPDDLAHKTKLFKTHLAGYNLCEELYIADLDIELHQCDNFWLDVVRKLWPVYKCMPLDKKDSHPCSFTEIFSGDWGAAQFSHLYSKVIAADIMEAFEDNNENMNSIGERFKKTFLSLGGAVPAAEVFRRFRGRDPSVEALLKSLNIWRDSRTPDSL
uniref:Peptidase M3A/M3B catalytic domain-containing protein n=1 Tax=Glossina pallidipes TaxID=7398 RepID=A0A1A9ZDS5_GLOPL